jgi:lysophospholipase L1-like esterase
MRITMNRTLMVAASVSVLSALVSWGCTTNGGTPPPTIQQITYTAIGASDAVGVGATQCVTAGTPAMPSPPSCPGGNGYVPVLAGALANSSTTVTLYDLGISGAVIGPDIMTDTTACFGAPGNFIINELPQVNAKTNTVTIFAGGNDTNAIVACAVGIAQGGGDPTAFIKAEIGKFGADYATLIQGVKKASPPGVTIFVANLPNFALIPVGQKQPAAVQALLQQISVAIDQTIINPSAGVTVTAVIDTLCRATSYDPNNFSADGFHPNAIGYSVLAVDYDVQIVSARTGSALKPAVSCPPYTTALARRTITPSDAANTHLWRY